MDFLTFLSKIIPALAWPAATTFFLLLLKDKIGDLALALAARIKRAKFPGGEIEFAEKLDEVKKETETLEAKTEQRESARKDDEPITADDPYLRLAEVSPPAAVLEAFKQLRADIMENRHYFPNIKSSDAMAYVQALHDANAIGADIVQLFARVRNLRNFAVHARNPDISLSQALEYRELCRTLSNHFAQAFALVENVRQGPVDEPPHF